MRVMRKSARRISSFHYFLRRVRQKILAFKISYRIVALLLIGAVIFLLGGGVYDVVVKPSPYGVSPEGEIVFFRPRTLQDQLLGGSIIVMILYALGTLGLLMAYRSTKYVYNPRHAAILLLVGVAFMILAFMLMESIIHNYKT